MKVILVALISACCAVQVYADDNCGNAVDDADSMNVNQQDCDYTDEGLNGVLHKAFKQGSEGAVLETADEKPVAVKTQTATVAVASANKATSGVIPFMLRVEVDQWPSVALARTQLLPKAMEKCAKGFAIEREEYRSLAMGRIALSIEFSCLE